jgi:hypothetical protein
MSNEHQLAYPLKPPYIADVLSSCDPRQLNATVAEIKNNAVAALHEQFEQREDKETMEAQTQFAILERHAVDYVDYRMRLSPRTQMFDGCQQSLNDLAACGVQRHVGEQLMRMAEKAAELEICQHMGRAL